MQDIGPAIRDMASEDLEQVIALDAQAGGMSRNDFFHRRWQAMEAGSENYIGLVAVTRDGVDGFALGHILAGEFGTDRRLAVIDSIAVSPALRGIGVGNDLMNALKAAAAARQCIEIRTLAGWAQQDLLAFFARSGFQPAPVNVLEKTLAGS